MFMYAWMKFVETAPERYDAAMKIMTMGVIDVIKDQIAKSISSGDNILDIGCGTGTLAVRCMKNGAYVTGLDSSDFMLAQARKNAEKEGLADKLKTVHDSVTQLSKHFNENTFDAITATASLGEFPKSYLEYILNESAKLLKDNGRLIIADELQPGNKILRIMYNLTLGILWIPQFLILRRVCYPIKDLDKILEEAGFRIEQKNSFPPSMLQLIFARKKCRS